MLENPPRNNQQRKRNFFRASSFAPEMKSPLADSAPQSLLLHSRPVRMMVSVLSRTWSLARTGGTEPFLLLLLLLSGGRAWLVRPQGRESLPFPSWEQETRGVWSRNPVGTEKEGGARRVLAPGKAPVVARAEQGWQWGTAARPGAAEEQSPVPARPARPSARETASLRMGWAGKLCVFQLDRAAALLQPRGGAGIRAGSASAPCLPPL